MPYTPPAQRSPAPSAPHSPALSRRGSYQPGQTLGPPVSSRPELPRSTSYLTRHRRTPSVKSTAFAPTPESTPPSTGNSDQKDVTSVNASSGSIRQSPPPVTDDNKIPVGAVISPPDSAQNSSDDEETKSSRGRTLENLAELQAAIRIIEQHRESSPNRTALEVGKTIQALHLVMPSKAAEEEVVQTPDVLQVPRNQGHTRSNTDSAVFVGLRGDVSPETPLTGSDIESDEEGPERSRRKPPMLRKKSGELVRPALRPSSARRRPSSMPGTPTFSKAVHFDSHLEHVRHFLQVDRPLAVSAGSSPVELYDSDTEFPFGEDDSKTTRSPPWEWEIVVSNFPAETQQRLSLPVRVERVFLSADNKNLIGSVAVANLAFNKGVVARFTLDYWKTTSEVVAEFNNDIRQQKNADGYDRFNFNIKLADQANLEAKTMFFCVKYCVNGQEYWDNNNNTNFQIDFRKKYKPQNGKKGMQGASSRPVQHAQNSQHHSLPRSHRSPPTTAGKPGPPAFDDFAEGFDQKYKFLNTKESMRDFLAEPDRAVKLKSSQSAISLSSDNLTRRVNPNGQAFGNRYDFGASLSAAIQAANSALGDRSGISMKPSPKKSAKIMVDAPTTSSPISTGSPMMPNKPSAASNKITPASSTSGTDSPRASGAEKPVIASQSYNELLDKYCFFGSNKNSPQAKDGTLRPGPYDGNNDDVYVLGSVDSTASNSPLMMQAPENKNTLPRAQPQPSTQAARSASPAPMTGFATGTSPMYHHLHGGFLFNEAHAATAIRG
ncbi:protein phosphatase regulator [Phlyctema vagabunda]|uniref:Protein phosphatase regulator n=1 Tax=Phlyctema vagabunda TaxID=108571 RepID=A0ABR4PNQ9_9HELO